MKKAISYIFGFWFAFAIHFADVSAQYSPPLWIRQAGSNHYTDEPIVIYDGGNHIYFLGHFSRAFMYDDTILEEKGVRNIFISKLDTLGNLVWIKRFWNSYGYKGKFLYYLSIRYAAVDKNKNIFFTGSFKDTINAVDTTFYAVGEDHDFYLMKMTPEGEIAWFYNMEGGVVPYQEATSLSIDENNNVILSTEDYDNNFLFKFDNSGELLWYREYENLNNCSVYSVVTDKENNIYISGNFKDYITFDNDTIFSMAGNDLNGFFAKFDENGDYIWARLIGSSCKNYYVSPYLRIDTSMNILVSCGIPNCAVYIGQDSIVPMGTKSKLMAMVNQDGNVLWYHQAYSDNNIRMSANVLDNKNNVYCAITYRYNSYVGFSDSIVPGDQTILLIKLDQEGNIQWMKNQGGNISNNIWLGNLAPDYSDNLYFAGYFKGLAIFGDTSFYSSCDKLFIAKINDSSWIKQTLSGITENDIAPVVGPNPVTNELYINLTPTGEKAEYSIYNIYGIKVASGFIENGRKVLKTDTFASGLYFLVLKDNQKESVVKFIKR